MTRLRQQLAHLETVQTERQLVNQTLLESQAHIINMLDVASEAIISVDEAQQIILFNKGAETIFGYSAAEVAGQPLDILLPERLAARHRRHIDDFADSPVTTRMMGERQEIVGRRQNGQEFPAEASISKIEAAGKKFFTVVLRDITERKQFEERQQEFINELKALNEATRTITSELSLAQVLDKIAETARVLIKARYAALGMHDGQGRLARFSAAGLSPTQRARIGPLPTGQGLLGLLLHQGQSLIINDIARHPAAIGFPEHHPVMRSLLGVPIFSQGELIGAIYLTDKVDGSHFSEADRHLTEMLAYHAAIAIENARLYEQTQRLAILEERERFARDLHDGIIQSTYGVGLSLDSAKAAISASNETARTMIDLSLKSLAQVITDIRNYIFDLRPQALKDKGLHARLQGLLKELKINSLLTIRAEIDPDINHYLTDSQASHIFHITHEGLANVVRHAGATKAGLTLTRSQDRVILQIEDNGAGFEPPADIAHGHRGLGNIQQRASLLDADLNIDSQPGRGTRLSLSLEIQKSISESPLSQDEHG